MSYKKEVRQGDVYMANFSFNSVEHEQTGVRPVLIVSCDSRNNKSNNVFVFPIEEKIVEFGEDVVKKIFN